MDDSTTSKSEPTIHERRLDGSVKYAKFVAASPVDILRLIEFLLTHLQTLARYLPLASIGLDIPKLRAAINTLRQLVEENAYLKRALDLLRFPQPDMDIKNVTFSFGPNRQYTLFLPRQQINNTREIAAKFRAIADELDGPQKCAHTCSRKFLSTQQFLPFSDSK